MPGWVLGAVVVVAAVAFLKRRRYLREAYYGAPWGGGFAGRSAWESPHPFRRHGRHGGGLRRGMLRGLFLRLDTSPGQEKAIVGALSEARERLSELKHELGGSRRDVAALIASDVLDPAALEELLARQRGVLEQLSQQLARGITTVHEVLDTEQRRELGALLADGSIRHAFRAYSAC
jgi:Spy/CpxP family protein refolding chaperone